MQVRDGRVMESVALQSSIAASDDGKLIATWTGRFLLLWVIVSSEESGGSKESGDGDEAWWRGRWKPVHVQTIRVPEYGPGELCFFSGRSSLFPSASASSAT